MANGTITAAKGFLAAGIASGVKVSGKPDLGLVYCPQGATAAAMFTTNNVVAASVKVCKQHIRTSRIFAAVVNSGNANACTGTTGLAAAKVMCAKVGKELELKPEQVLIASTGIIGHKLPIKKVTDGIAMAAAALSNSAKAGLDFAKAIMTTDNRPKQAIRKVTIAGVEITLAGTVKGAGMIAPNMATTICMITTDAAIKRKMLGRAFKAAIGASLNRLTVDGHQSTNDTAMILASGAAENRTISKPGAAFNAFSAVLLDLTTDLAKQMALDAEGATRMFTVEVVGASSKPQAFKAARVVADYDLVKCAIHGADPNWGRIICAVGSCGVRFHPDKLTCKIGGVIVFRGGRPTSFDRARVRKIMTQKEHTIWIDLGMGKAKDFCYGCDLSREYITINADYHT
ncbi:MAG: bifunctional glutamate N-acetyltransferase/amino-acid acetyltransferase ArgJ [Sedimentisphaerales bacterium]|nr:bifunctional glutamate N-acetyltransferase/amino-acid acetyltransferase ArgJ [Sedimentisphaerales bacterium]